MPVKRTIAFALLLGLPLAARAQDPAPGPVADSSHAVVLKEGTIVFEKPDVLANAMRLLYAGEVVGILEVLQDPTGSKWLKIAMGGAEGYVRFADVQYGGTAKVKNWKPPVILRD